ncbi:MAG: glycosyltransferase [Acidimicrobiia bacterium]
MTALSATIVAYRSRDRLDACLAPLRRLEDLERVVVVDHGDDGSAEVAEALGAVVARDPSNPGYGAGQNGAVARTATPYVLLLNPDAIVEPAGIVAGIDLLDLRPDVAAVQGVVRSQAAGAPERSQGIALGPLHLLGRALGARRLLDHPWFRTLLGKIPALADHVERVPVGPTAVESLAAVAILVRRAAFDAVGGFDEEFFLYGEDIDLSYRLGLAGWVLVALPVEWAVHASGGSSAGWWERELVWWEGTMRAAAKWWAPRPWRVAMAAALVRVVALAVVRPRHARYAISRVVMAPRRARRASGR